MGLTGVNQDTFLTCPVTSLLLSMEQSERCGLVLRYWNVSALIPVLVLSLT